MERGLGKFHILFHFFTFLSTIKIEQCIYYCGRNIENSTNLLTLSSTNLPGIEHAPPVTGCGHSTIEPWKLYLLTQHSYKETSPPPHTQQHTSTLHNSTQVHKTTNVPVVFMVRHIMILRGATSLLEALEGVGPESLDFFGPKKVLIFRAHPFKCPS
jgi:hypothetical protein